MDEQCSGEVEFFVVENNAAPGAETRGRGNTGTLIEWSSSGTGMLTLIPLQPGDIVQLRHEGASKLGIVMWSVESSNKFRIQMRFV